MANVKTNSTKSTKKATKTSIENKLVPVKEEAKTKVKNKPVPIKKETKKESNVKNSTKTKTSTVKKEIKNNNTKQVKKEEINNIKDDELDIVKVDLSSERKDEYYDILENEKSHFFIKLLITILILLSCLFIIYKFVIRDQKAIFTSGINTIYEKLANNIVRISNIDLLKDNIEIDGVLSINTNDKNNDDLNNYLYDVIMGINRSDNKYKLLVNIKENNNTLTSFNYYYINNNYYLNLGNNYDKTILLKKNVLEFEPSIINYANINYNKLNDSAKSIKNTINSNIDRNKLSKGEVNINNDKYEYVELSLTNEEYSNMVSSIIDNIKNTNYLIDNLSKSFNVDNEKILNMLDELQKKNLTNNFENISFRFYTYGFMANIVGFEIKIDNNQTFYYFNHDSKKDNPCDNCTRQTYLVLVNYKDYNVYIDKNGNTYNSIIKKNNQDYLHLVFNEFNDNTIDINYELYDSNIHGNIHYSKYDKKNDKSGNIKYSYINKNITTSINYDYRISNNANINLNNNYINVENLSEDDYLSIGNNISKSIKNNAIKNKYKDIFERIYNY